MAFIINTINKDVEPSIYIRAVPKWGKTTFFRDFILAKYGDPSRGILLPIGNENGTRFLPRLGKWDRSIKTWDEFKKVLEEIVKIESIRYVALDTVSELRKLAEEKVLEDWNTQLLKEARANGTRFVECKSIKAAEGGFNAGPRKAAEMISGAIGYIEDHDKRPFVIAHTKYSETNKNKGTTDDETYMALTSDLGNTYDSEISKFLDIIVTGNMVFNYEEDTKKVMGRDKKVRYAVDEGERRLYFRSADHVDAGGRLAAGTLPAYMIMEPMKNNAATFIDIISEAIRLSDIVDDGERLEIIAEKEPELAAAMTTDKMEEPAPVSKPEAQAIEPDPVEIEAVREEEEMAMPFEDEDLEPTKDELIEEVKIAFSKCTNEVNKAKAQKKRTEAGGKLANCSIEELKEILEILA